MMPSRFIVCLITVFCLKGVYLSKEKQVSQTPREMLVKPNADVNLSCTHDISSYDTILWYQRSPGDTSLKLIGYVYFKTPKVESAFQNRFNVSGDGEKTAYLHILNLSPPEDTGEYFGAARRDRGREAYFGQGTKLTVLEDGHNITSPKVEVLKPSKYECRNKKDENRKKTIVCVASGFYPDHVSVSWQLNKEKVTKGVATDNAALRDGETYKITSRLRVSAEDWFKPDNKFKCIVSFYNGTSEVNYEKSVNGEKAENTGSTMTKEQYLKVTHAGKLSYVVFIIKSCIYGVFVGFLVWKLQGSAGKANI